jgi:hypothetical protein
MAATFVERRGARVEGQPADAVRPTPGIGFIVAWVVAIALASGLAAIVEAGLFSGVRGLGATASFWMGLVAAGVSGAFQGIATGLVLRRYMPYWRTWTAATAFGTVLAYALGLAVVLAGTFNAGSRAGVSAFSSAWIMTSPLVLQLVITSFQWLVLRRAVRRAWIWIVVATLTSSVVTMGSYALGAGALGLVGPLELAALGTIGGLLGALITGPTMAWLIRGRSFRRA